MKKNFVTLLVALLATASGARADDGVWVERLDGTKQGFLFVDEPKITCDADILVLKTSSATVEFPIAELKRLYFSDDIVTGVAPTNAGITSEIIRATCHSLQPQWQVASAVKCGAGRNTHREPLNLTTRHLHYQSKKINP